MTDPISRAAVLAILKTMPKGMAKQFGRLTRKVEALPGVDVLTDPIAVHANMLRGTIAKPTLAQIIHLYGVEELRIALAQITATPAERKTPGL